MSDPAQILDQAMARAVANLSKPAVRNRDVVKRVEYICRCLHNRAGVRLLMACLLAKIDRPGIDPRKPYTEIDDANAFSGRSYDATTDVIDDHVKAYAAESYAQTGGTELVILDCIGFLRHFLHLFHRLRIGYLDIYQTLVLAEPDSAVSQPLKEAFLALRQAAEAD